MEDRKRLIILRHGQAVNAGFNEHDHSRELTSRGIKEATEMGELLASGDFIPDKVICSTAQRTRMTFDNIEKALSEPLNVDYLPQIYNASEHEIFNQIVTITDDIKTLMLIGHNPALYQISLTLAKDGDKTMHDNLHTGFPTCSLAIIEFNGKWQDIMLSRSKILLFSTPK
ncbi:MAG: histidine phosphatase family protein [Rickettsiales bacterium]